MNWFVCFIGIGVCLVVVGVFVLALIELTTTDLARYDYKRPGSTISSTNHVSAHTEQHQETEPCVSKGRPPENAKQPISMTNETDKDKTPMDKWRKAIERAELLASGKLNPELFQNLHSSDEYKRGAALGELIDFVNDNPDQESGLIPYLSNIALTDPSEWVRLLAGLSFWHRGDERSFEVWLALMSADISATVRRELMKKARELVERPEMTADTWSHLISKMDKSAAKEFIKKRRERVLDILRNRVTFEIDSDLQRQIERILRSAD